MLVFLSHARTHARQYPCNRRLLVCFSVLRSQQASEQSSPVNHVDTPVRSNISHTHTETQTLCVCLCVCVSLVLYSFCVFFFLSPVVAVQTGSICSASFLLNSILASGLKNETIPQMVLQTGSYVATIAASLSCDRRFRFFSPFIHFGVSG